MLTGKNWLHTKIKISATSIQNEYWSVPNFEVFFIMHKVGSRKAQILTFSSLLNAHLSNFRLIIHVKITEERKCCVMILLFESPAYSMWFCSKRQLSQKLLQKDSREHNDWVLVKTLVLRCINSPVKLNYSSHTVIFFVWTILWEHLG